MAARTINVRVPEALYNQIEALAKATARTKSFFQLLKRERIKRKTYPTREAARQEVFDYIEMFYNPVRRHGYNGKKSPVQFERQFFERQRSV